MKLTPFALSTLALTALAGAPSDLAFSVVGFTDFDETVVHPGIDSSDGPVRGVSCCVRYKLNREISVENEGELQTDLDAFFGNGDLTVLLQGVPLHDVQFIDAGPTFSLDGYDGTTDFAGGSGEFRDLPPQSGFVSVTITDPSLLAGLVDQGPLELRVIGSDTLAIAAPANVEADGLSTVRIDSLVVVHQ